jgi:hypothetical protein
LLAGGRDKPAQMVDTVEKPLLKSVDDQGVKDSRLYRAR